MTLPDVSSGKSTTKIDLDLSQLGFACPLDLTGLAAWCTAITPRCRGAVLLPQEDIASYLERMNLLSLLRNAGWGVPGPSRQDREILVDRLLEVTSLADATAVEKLSNSLLTLFTANGHSRTRARALHFGFGELCDNAVTHSGSSPIFVAAQRYSGITSGGDPRLELAVADGGIGIGNHLRGNRKYMNVLADETAIRLALKPGVTGTGEQRGYGLHDVVRSAAEVGPGEMVIYSGRGAAYVPWGFNGRRRRFRPMPRGVPGTWIQIRLYED